MNLECLLEIDYFVSQIIVFSQERFINITEYYVIWNLQIPFYQIFYFIQDLFKTNITLEFENTDNRNDCSTKKAVGKKSSKFFICFQITF